MGTKNLGGGLKGALERAKEKERREELETAWLRGWDAFRTEANALNDREEISSGLSRLRKAVSKLR